MKKLILLLALAIICLNVSAQEEPAKTDSKDTIRVGGMIIVKKGKGKMMKGRIIVMKRGP